jgi:hypothetical protein
MGASIHLHMLANRVFTCKFGKLAGCVTCVVGLGSLLVFVSDRTPSSMHHFATVNIATSSLTR